MYSREPIQEAVSVRLFTNHLTHKAGPSVLYWRGKTYRITNIGIHHLVREGRALMHIFSVTDGTTYFKLKFDTESLSWQLVEIGTE